jgi:hypothetical protein
MKRLQDFEIAFQGDIWMMKLPDNYVQSNEMEHEIGLINGKLILQEGEMTGHHHHIDVMERPATKSFNESWWEEFDDPTLRDIFGQERPAFSAKLFAASKVANKLVSDQKLMRPDLTTGLLIIENGPAKVQHQEHDFIGLMPGKYVVGRQLESVAGEERRVAD